jgi:hypothetical protein
MAKISGLESVIQGLRQERELWSKELAVQGATLAADHGRLESQIKVLEAEVTSARAAAANTEDSLRIKVKMLDDQVFHGGGGGRRGGHTSKRKIQEKGRKMKKKERSLLGVETGNSFYRLHPPLNYLFLFLHEYFFRLHQAETIRKLKSTTMEHERNIRRVEDEAARRTKDLQARLDAEVELSSQLQVRPKFQRVCCRHVDLFFLFSSSLSLLLCILLFFFFSFLLLLYTFLASAAGLERGPRQEEQAKAGTERGGCRGRAAAPGECAAGRGPATERRLSGPSACTD